MNSVVNKEKVSEKKVNSNYHTLFIENVGEERTEKNGLFKITPSYKRYTMYIDMFQEFDPQKLHEIYNKLWSADYNDELVFVINSYGGFIDEGLSLINIARNKFKNRITTILNCAAYSMGALLFSIGDKKRIVMKQSDFMYHDYAGGNFGKGGELEAISKHKSKFIRNMMKEIIVDQKFLSEKEFEKMKIGQDYWFDSEELCRRGIATHVMIDGKLVKAKKYLKKLNKKS